MQAVQIIALLIIIAFALWIAVGSLVAIARPAIARGWIARFAASQTVNIAEQAWRGLAGGALLVRAGDSLAPEVFRVVGVILVASAAILLVVPLRWHSAYAVWWSQNLPLWAMRLAGMVGLALAAGGAVAAFGFPSAATAASLAAPRPSTSASEEILQVLGKSPLFH